MYIFVVFSLIQYFVVLYVILWYFATVEIINLLNITFSWFFFGTLQQYNVENALTLLPNVSGMGSGLGSY